MNTNLKDQTLLFGSIMLHLMQLSNEFVLSLNRHLSMPASLLQCMTKD